MKASVDFFVIIPLLVCFLGGLHTCQARMGLSETHFHTPGGHIICDCDNMLNYDQYAPSILGFEQEIPRITHFYFYKQHIIGYSDTLFFIFDEATEMLTTYANETTWETALTKHNLHPFVKRWLTIHDSPQGKLLIAIFLSLFLVPLGLVFVYFYVKMFTKALQEERFSLYGIHTKVFIGLTLLLLWLLSELFWIESF